MPRGWGVPIRTTGEKSLALCLLCEVQSNTHILPPKMISTSSMYVTYTVLLSDTFCIHIMIYGTYHYLPYSMVRTECTYVQCCGSGSGVGSRINHFGSGFGQHLFRMTLKQNFSDKIHNFSTNAQLKNTCSRLADFTLVYILKNFIYRRNFTNIKCKFAAQLSRWGDQRCRTRNMIRIRSRLRI